jgi:hypothetical protein
MSGEDPISAQRTFSDGVLSLQNYDACPPVPVKKCLTFVMFDSVRKREQANKSFLSSKRPESRHPVLINQKWILQTKKYLFKAASQTSKVRTIASPAPHSA